MAVIWNKIFQASYYNLHSNPRPEILILAPITSQIIAIELSKIGGWDENFLGWLCPFNTIPVSPQKRFYSTWKRLYLGSQLVALSKSEQAGNLEIKPRLWIPDISVTIWASS
ncbi:hypothetical protein [Anabaena sp. PCC 7108]|uniref:hypothetical protein n=1 Tax=Anabaena sp. PCC 7108 TaxID=163908 RepID=UPI00037E544F|nr:hypothetical protein [Anabaena sp. PCC 7108]